MRESRVENHLVRGAKRRGGDVRKLAWLGRRHAPDRLVLWPHPGVLGQHDLVELKAPGEEARGGQAREHERLRRAGFNVFLLDTIEKVDNYLATRT